MAINLLSQIISIIFKYYKKKPIFTLSLNKKIINKNKKINNYLLKKTFIIFKFFKNIFIIKKLNLKAIFLVIKFTLNSKYIRIKQN